MRLERGQAPLGVRNEPDDEAACPELMQHLGHLLVEREVMTGRPLVVDVACGAIHVLARTAHAGDDLPGVVDEDLRIVGVALVVQRGRGGHHRVAEPVGVHRDAMPGAEVAIAGAEKRVARMDQREVDVEEDRARHVTSRRDRPPRPPHAPDRAPPRRRRASPRASPCRAAAAAADRNPARDRTPRDVCRNAAML